MSNKVYRLLQTQVMKVVVGLIVSFFLGYSLLVNWNQLQQHDLHINSTYLGLAFLCYSVNLGLSIINWHLLMVGTGGQTSFGDNAKIFCYSNFPKSVPGAVWYVMGRTYMYQKKGIDQTTVLLASATELLYLTLSGVLLCTFLLPFSNYLPITGYSWLLSMIMLPFFSATLFNKLLVRIQNRFSPKHQAQFRQKEIIAIALNYSLAWIWGGTILFLLINGMGPLPAKHLIDVIIAWTVSGVASLTTAFVVNGMGVKEVTLTVLLSDYLSLPIAIVISVLFKLLIIIGDVIWSIIIIGFLSVARRLFRLACH